jgi:hypothetical protein
MNVSPVRNSLFSGYITREIEYFTQEDGFCNCGDVKDWEMRQFTTKN